MRPRSPHITAAELNVLKAIWRLGTATVRDVLEQLAGDASDRPAYTTVMTLMNQLASKGVLHVDRDRTPYVYRAALRRDQVLTQRLREFVNDVFDGQAGELVLRLVESADLTDDDLKRIEARIESMERRPFGPPTDPSSASGASS